MVSVVLCAAFSGFAGFGLSFAVAEGAASGAGLASLALGLTGLAGLVAASLGDA